MDDLAQRLRQERTLLKAEDVAEFLGVSLRKVLRMAKQGSLPYLRIGESYRFDPHTLADWLSTRTVPAYPRGKVVKKLTL